LTGKTIKIILLRSIQSFAKGFCHDTTQKKPRFC
jgi:hypothetical protein